MKISKLSFVLVIAIIAISALATSVSAYTSNDLANYITGSHSISGSQFELKDSEKQQVKDYLNSNPLTDAQATEIKGLLDQAKNKISATGSSNLNQISDSTKAQVVALIKQAGNVAGLDISVDTRSKTVTISKANEVLLSGSYNVEGNGGITVRTYTNPATTGNNGSGAAGSSSVNTLVYTGSNNTIFVVLAVLAVVAVSTVIAKKVYAK